VPDDPIETLCTLALIALVLWLGTLLRGMLAP
jgi:hypothetical protein